MKAQNNTDIGQPEELKIYFLDGGWETNSAIGYHRKQIRPSLSPERTSR